MKAPQSHIFESLPKEIRRDIILGKRKDFVYNGKTYTVTNGEESIDKELKRIDDMIEQFERLSKINKIQNKINPKLRSKWHWWIDFKFFIQKLF